MADPEHVAILKQGVEVWNRWRSENPQIQPDLSFFSQYMAHLPRVDFHQANLLEFSKNKFHGIHGFGMFFVN